MKKKEDLNGRWIMDFRPLNAATVKRPTPVVGDVASKARRLAGRRWESTLDAQAGFNQMGASKRASKLMQIITSMGLLQWVVLPFGVTNSPPYFQEFMLSLFNGSSLGLDNLLQDSMSDLETFDIFVDDLDVGTGDAPDVNAWERDSTETGKAD